MALSQKLFDAIVDGKAQAAQTIVGKELEAAPTRWRSFPER